MSVKSLNIDTEFKIAWIGFLHLDEIMYTASEFKKKSTFVEIHATKIIISFVELDQYDILRLKYNKTVVEHKSYW